VKEELAKMLNSIETMTLSSEDADKVRQLTKSNSGWDKTKRAGMSAVPPGDATQRVERLIANLREIGLFVVEEGELEGFVRQVGGHGRVWVSAVHEQGLHANKSLTKPRAFMQAVVASL